MKQGNKKETQGYTKRGPMQYLEDCELQLVVSSQVQDTTPLVVAGVR